MGQVTSWGCVRGNQWMYLSHISLTCFSLSLSPPSSLKINKLNLSKKRRELMAEDSYQLGTKMAGSGSCGCENAPCRPLTLEGLADQGPQLLHSGTYGGCSQPMGKCSRTQGENEGWASAHLLHLGNGRTLDIVAGEPLWRTKPGDVWVCQSCC